MRRLVQSSAAALAVLGLILVSGAPSQASSSVSFAGYTWSVKTSPGLVGPGPNLFSDSASNVFTDGLGRLHLRIIKSGEAWTCAEVVNTASLGYGTYRWVIDNDVTGLDRNAVLGLFTWSDNPAYAHRELDIEFSKWGDSSATRTGWYVVQTDDGSAPPRKNFALPVAPTSTHTLRWAPGLVVFTSTAGGKTVRWKYRGPAVPVPGDEAPRMNLWLDQGRPPAGSQEVVIRSFSFTPRA